MTVHYVKKLINCLQTCWKVLIYLYRKGVLLKMESSLNDVKRTKNYKQSEIDILMSCLEPKKNIIECKQTRCSYTKRKGSSMSED